MIYLGILFVGALRIVQANCNKQTSSFMQTTAIRFRYGAYFELAAAIFSFLYLCLWGFYGWNAVTLVCAFLSATCFVVELVTSLEAMKRAPLVLCNMCALGGGIILPSIAAIFFFDEPMSLFQWLGVGVFFVSAYFLSPGGKQQPTVLTMHALLILAVNFLVNGICATVGKYFAVRVESGNVPLFSFLTYGISALLFIVVLLIMRLRSASTPSGEKSSQSPAPLPRKLYLYGGLLGITCATIVCTTTTLSRTVPVVVMNTIPSTISIIGCLFIGSLFFKEKITVRNVLGVLSGILSVIMIVSL